MTQFMKKAGEPVSLARLDRKITVRSTRLRIAVLLAVCLFPALARTQNDNWLGGTGNWSNPSKWSAGVPAGTSNAFIDNGNALASPVMLDINGVATNLTINADDSLSFNNGVSLSIGAAGGGTINNAGHLNINSTGTATSLIVVNAVPAAVTLTGGGTLKMSNNPNNVIGIFGGGLINVNNTIQGAGHIGNTQMGLNNQGTINANIGGAGANPLIIDTAGTGSNTGTMEATTGGTLEVHASFNNTGGKIQAVGAGSVVLLGPDTSFSGGTLTTSAGGIVGVANNTNNEHAATLEGMTNTVTNAGTFEVFDGGTVVLDGTISNTGSILLNGASASTLLDVSGPTHAATLTGSGTVTMSNSANNTIGVFGGGLSNLNNTIQGAGQIGNTQMGLNNQGTINANIGGPGANPLIINTAGTGSNTGTMEATNGGTLQLQASFSNTGGKIEATGAGSTVIMGPDTSFSGGTLTTSGGGIIGVTTTSSEHAATLEGFTNIVTNAGTFEVFDGAALVLDGTINNTGSILMNGLNNSTLLDVSGPNHAATLTGKGTVIMSNSPNNVIGVFGGGLTNMNNTIEGAGHIGNTQAGVNNKGKIVANQPTALIIDAAGFSNPGTLIVNKGSLMNITGPFSNFLGTTLTGGTYMVSGTLQFNGANIVNDAAHITLTGATSAIIDQAASDGVRGLAAIAKKGSLTLRSGKTLLTPGDLSSAGKLTVGAGTNLKVTGSYTQTGGTTTVDGTLTAPSGTVIQAGSVFGRGTIASTVVSSGSFTAGDSPIKTGKLSPSTYTQNASGSLNIAIGGLTAGTQYGQLAVANGASLGGTLNVTLLNSFVPTVGSTFTILTTSARTGQFATVNGLGINGSEHFTITYNPTNLTLTVASGP
jgi:fibronectin-binding autotransporter adhesin